MLYETGQGAYRAVAEYAGAEQAAVTPAKKPVQKKVGTTEKGASIQKPKPLVKTAAKKIEKK